MFTKSILVKISYYSWDIDTFIIQVIAYEIVQGPAIFTMTRKDIIKQARICALECNEIYHTHSVFFHNLFFFILEKLFSKSQSVTLLKKSFSLQSFYKKPEHPMCPNHNSTQLNITLVGLDMKMILHTYPPPYHPTPHRNSMLAISQLLLTRFWWNFKRRFLGASGTDYKCHIDICPGNIFPGEICPY